MEFASNLPFNKTVNMDRVERTKQIAVFFSWFNLATAVIYWFILYKLVEHYLPQFATFFVIVVCLRVALIPVVKFASNFMAMNGTVSVNSQLMGEIVSPKLWRAIQAVGMRTSISGYRFYMYYDKLPSAKAVRYGRRRNVLVSSAAIELLSEEELQAVLAHEIGHLRNEDFRLGQNFALVFAILFGSILVAFAGRSKLLVLMGILFILASAGILVPIYLLMLPRILINMMSIAWSERAADAESAKIMGTPAIMRSALKVIADTTINSDGEGAKKFVTFFVKADYHRFPAMDKLEN